MTAPNTSIRALRHSIRKLTHKALMLTCGEPGLPQEAQIHVLDAQISLLETALAKAKEARGIVANRDFGAYKAAKDAKAAMPDAEKIPASEEAAMADLTFSEIVKQLGGGADKPQGTPPS